MGKGGIINKSLRKFLEGSKELSDGQRYTYRKRAREEVEKLPEILENSLNDLKLLIEFYKEDYDANKQYYNHNLDDLNKECSESIRRKFPEVLKFTTDYDQAMMIYQFLSMKKMLDYESYRDIIEILDDLEDLPSVDWEESEKLWDQQSRALQAIKDEYPVLTQKEVEHIHVKLGKPTASEFYDTPEDEIESILPDLLKHDEGNIVIDKRMKLDKYKRAKTILSEDGIKSRIHRELVSNSGLTLEEITERIFDVEFGLARKKDAYRAAGNKGQIKKICESMAELDIIKPHKEIREEKEEEKIIWSLGEIGEQLNDFTD